MAFTDLPLHRSVPFGIAAYLVGYVATVAVVAARIRRFLALEVTGEFVASATLLEVLGGPPSPWVVGGWGFYNAHFVPTSVPAADALNGLGGSPTDRCSSRGTAPRSACCSSRWWPCWPPGI